MAYVLLPNIGNTLGGTRDQIRTNFTLLKTTIDKNHIDMDGSFPGKHIMSQYNTASFPGTAVLEAGDATIYGKSVGGVSEIFFSPDDTTDEYQLTKSDTANFATFFGQFAPIPASSACDGGWTFLPGGLLVNYGKQTISSNTSLGVITFAVPFTTAIYSIQCTIENIIGTAPNMANVNTVTLSNMAWSCSGILTTGLVHWYVIGK